MCLTLNMYKIDYFADKCSGNCYFKMLLMPNTYKIITLKANAQEIVTLKCV